MIDNNQGHTNAHGVQRNTARLIAGLATSLAALLTPAAHAANGGQPDTWTGVRQAGTLRCGAAVSAPVVLRDVRSGQYHGPFADLCRTFAKELGVTAVFVDTTWGNIVAGVQTGKWDIALALNRTPEREKAVTFSAPLLTTSSTLVYHQSNPKIPKASRAIADIDRANVTISVMQGSSIDRDMTLALKHARLLRLPDADSVRLALIARRADMLADDAHANAVFLAAQPDWSASYELEPPLAPQDMGFGLHPNTSAADLAAFNQTIEREIASGRVQASFEASVQQSLKNAQ